MPYTFQHWKDRIASRVDLSAQVVHLTREGQIGGLRRTATSILLKILTDEQIRGSSTERGFIVGGRRAVCFQDAPLYSIAQNVYGEEQYRRANPGAPVRYIGTGLAFTKPYVYRKGGRPVIYDDTAAAKQYLPPEEWWRIVRFDLNDESRIIDWTHEREWRVPDDFGFDLNAATVILPNNKARKVFMERCRRMGREDILDEVRSIVVLGTIFF